MTGRRAKSGEGIAFLNKCVKTDTDNCLPWPFSISGVRRAVIRVKTGRGDVSTLNVKAYVLAAKEGKSHPPAGYYANEVCSTANCCNYKHIRWDLISNSRSKSAAIYTPLEPEDLTTVVGRKRARRLAKLSRAEVAAVRRSLLEGESVDDLMNEYEVSRNEILRYQ